MLSGHNYKLSPLSVSKMFYVIISVITLVSFLDISQEHNAQCHNDSVLISHTFFWLNLTLFYTDGKNDRHTVVQHQSHLKATSKTLPNCVAVSIFWTCPDGHP